MTDKTLSIGIVVPVLNEAAQLPELLQSLKPLAADDVVIVDGGSCDGSRELLAASGFRWLASSPGRAVQMNAGAASIHSDVTLFLHADTRLSPCHLDDIRRCLGDREYVGGRFDVQLEGGHSMLPLVALLMNLRSRLSRISTGDQAIFVRREVFEALGGFSLLPLMEDVEFSRRLKRAGRICCLRRKVITSARRWQQRGVWRTIGLMWRLRLLYWLGVDAERLATYYREVR